MGSLWVRSTKVHLFFFFLSGRDQQITQNKVIVNTVLNVADSAKCQCNILYVLMSPAAIKHYSVCSCTSCGVKKKYVLFLLDIWPHKTADTKWPLYVFCGVFCEKTHHKLFIIINCYHSLSLSQMLFFLLQLMISCG